MYKISLSMRGRAVGLALAAYAAFFPTAQAAVPPKPAPSASVPAWLNTPDQQKIRAISNEHPSWPPLLEAPAISREGLNELLTAKKIVYAAVVVKTPEQSTLYVRTNDGKAWSFKTSTLSIPGDMNVLTQRGIPYLYEQDKGFATLKSAYQNGFFSTLASKIPFMALLGQLLFFAVLVLVMVWVQIKASKAMTGKRVRAVKPKDIKVSFDDVAGVDEAVRDMREAVAFLNKPESFTRLGATLPKGILLVGPPGGGKTLLAKAFAKASDAPFYAVSGSEFVELYVGTGAARVRSLFKKARKAGKAVIFIDEIDALTKARGGIGSHSEAEQTLNQLLVEMDGLAPTKSQIIVIGATNRVDAMDEAVLRPGRFDRQIHVSTPSLKGREDILRVYLKEELVRGVLSQDDLNRMARLTPDFSGAQIANLVNEARIRAARNGGESLTPADLIAARDKILLGDPRKDLDLIESERRTTAIHESGHAVVALAVSKDPVERVTIEPRSRALGLMLQLPERAAVSFTESEARARLLVLLGGRAAEAVFNGDVTTGASNDMERAHDLALRMVSQWGYGSVLGQNGVSDLNKLSPGLRESVEREAVDLVNSAYKDALALVQSRRDAVERLVERLLVEETIGRETVLELAR
jgi:cell division protease FtsH